MNNLKKQTKIDADKLSGEFYFQSLLQEAFVKGELSPQESERIQLECLKLLADCTERFTKGKSSSVRVEIAQGIMASNLYTIGLYLKTLPDLDTALFHIKNEPIEKLYEYGHSVLKRKINVANYFFHLVCKTKFKTQNQAYNITIDDGFKPFFKNYDINFHAHEIPSDIDYQLIHPVTDLAGVEFVISYLENLYYENLFCSYFDADIIDAVMSGYDPSYQNLLDNICAQVFQNALGCNLLNISLAALDFCPAELTDLNNDLKHYDQAELQKKLTITTHEVIATLEITNVSLKKYLLASLPKLTTIVYNGLATNTLNKVFVPCYNAKLKPIIHYNMGIKMDDKTYRDIVMEFLSCRYFEDKLAIIKEHIKTLADMEDLLIAGELESPEAALIFDLLDDTELAVLSKRHPLRQEVEAIDYSAAEIRMQQNLNTYLRTQPRNRLAKILKMATTIEVI
ncbi:DUF6179 domain-containing protein [Acetobacterium woodii]|uniref:Uncharacterized protein n=1 Tax=Acetobacterium woodii (strain ATCC 29683 / DSM 1030 / JCM 2381 / KCTC 1655 / WB1) TaxID=931626 RepID=H6LIZ5_ACEWD|nr:DUF6179 domain-containing protein [Acetobacterium woodii]AFA47358.1 hypothetical protein Awo_c05590 [Acetobacterium woodii DSM 1030]